MHWPYLFFKAGKKPAESESPAPERSAPSPAPAEPPTIKPVPAGAIPRAQGKPPVVAASAGGLTATPTPPSPPKTQPLPASSETQTTATPTSVPAVAPAETDALATRTLPAMHGVMLRPPGRIATSSGAMPIGSAPLKNVAELMAEADPMKTGAVRMVDRAEAKPNSVEPSTAPPTAAASEAAAAPAPSLPAGPSPESLQNAGFSPIPPTPLPKKAEPLPSGANPVPTPRIAVSNPSLVPPPFPAFRPAVSSALSSLPAEARSQAESREMRILSTGSQAAETQELHPGAPAASDVPTVRIVPSPGPVDSPFILKAQKAAPTPKPVEIRKSTADLSRPADPQRVIPPPPPPTIPAGSVMRRKTKMADVARIVLPPRREDTQPLLPADSSAVVPPAFPVSAMTARPAPRIVLSEPASGKSAPSEPKPAIDLSKPEDAFPANGKALEAPPVKEIPVVEARPAEPVKAINVEPKPEPAEPGAEAKGVQAKELLKSESGTVEPAPASAKEENETPEVTASPAAPPAVETPAIDTPAAKAVIPVPGPVETPAKTASPLPVEPKADSEATKPQPEPAKVARDPEPATSSLAPALTPERRELHLANGEKIAGMVLSETPDAVYLQHGTLGVVTVPKAQIAKRLVEIILINGDRIVGDIMAETADTLYVRHASLGMLTVPRAQRSTRVVEAILKDGDRILGEVLTETDAFTVIRSATLGTVTVPHSQLAMLNRKVEQIELKALPAPVAELKDKS